MNRQLIFVIFPIIPAIIMDILIGDPRWIYHPVRIIGVAISLFESLFRRIFPKNKYGEFIGGLIIAVLIPSLFSGLIFALLYAAYKINFWLMIFLDSFLCYQMLAIKSLKVESDRVKNALIDGDIVGARKWLSYIVGRDTANLNEDEIIKATVETISENTSDGVVSPIFFIGIFGAPLCYFYKSVNTLDSMVGYKNNRYMYFGRASAIFDDILNYIPSRLSGIFIVISSFFCGYNYKNSWKIFLRDRKNHPSPNSAQTESATAGAIGIQLGGGGYYGGVYKEKKTIGDDLEKISASDIDKTQKMMIVASLIACIFVTACRGLVMVYFLR